MEPRWNSSTQQLNQLLRNKYQIFLTETGAGGIKTVNKINVLDKNHSREVSDLFYLTPYWPKIILHFFTLAFRVAGTARFSFI